MQRRQYLALAGVAATAGCARLGNGTGGGAGPDEGGDSGGGDLGDGFGGGSLPGYADLLDEEGSTVVSDAFGFISVDLSALVNDEGDTQTATPDGASTGARDALVLNPAVGLTSVAFLGFTLTGAGLSRLVAFGEAESPADLPVERVTMADATVLHGSFDPDAVASDVTGAGLSQTGTTGDFTTYAAEAESGDTTEITAVAVSSDFVIHDRAERGSEDFTDPRDVVDRAIRLHGGDEQRLHEGDEDARWLLETAGAGDTVLGAFAEGDRLDPDPPAGDNEVGSVVHDLFRDAKGVVQHLDVPSGGSGAASATAALVYPEAGLVDAERLKSIAGQDASDRTVRTDGPRVVVDASYDSY